MIEYAGNTVYFGGDTAKTRGFARRRSAFSSIDIAILPIAPFIRAIHVSRPPIDLPEAVEVFLDLRARYLVPMHYDTL